MIEFQSEKNKNFTKLTQSKPMSSIDDEVMIEPEDKPDLEPII